MVFNGQAYYNLTPSHSSSSPSQSYPQANAHASTSSQKLGTQAVLERLAEARRGGRGGGAPRITGKSIINRPATSQTHALPRQQRQDSYNAFPPNLYTQHYQATAVSQSQVQSTTQQQPLRMQHQLPQKPQTLNQGAIGQDCQPFLPANTGVSGWHIPTFVSASNSNITPLYSATPVYSSEPFPDYPPKVGQLSAQAYPSSHSNGRSYCQVCNIRLNSPVQLIAHQRNQHIKCCKAFEGCTFEALPDIVQLHEQDRHLIFKPGTRQERTKPDGPLDARIQGTDMKLETEEQIATWIAERKRKWPSTKNLEIKADRDAKRQAYEEASPANSWHKDGMGSVDYGHTQRGRGSGRSRGDLGRTSHNTGAGRGRGHYRDYEDRRGDFEEGFHATLRNPRPWQQATPEQLIAQPVDVPVSPLDERKVEDREDSAINTSEDEEEEARIVAQLLKPSPRRVPEANGIALKYEERIPDLESDNSDGNVFESDIEEGPEEIAYTRLDDVSSLAYQAVSRNARGREPEAGSATIEGGESHSPVGHDESGSSTAKVERLRSSTIGNQQALPSKKQKCNVWALTGNCKFGKRCVYSHDASDRASRKPSGPPPRPANPFERDGLLGKLLHNEIRHEMSDLAQAIDFLARNEWLEGVELYTGQKEEIDSKIKIIQIVGEVSAEGR